MQKPAIHEYPIGSYFSYYIEQPDSQNVIESLTEQLGMVENIYKNLSDDQQNFRYDAGKWSPKEILGHITDTERIFGFRALCIARGEQQSLPSFDENEYMDGANFADQSLEQLLEQFSLTRKGTIALLKTFSEEIASRMGVANGNAVSARALAWMITGHEVHHLRILKERYSIG
jgi:DinB superfamily